MSYISFKTVGSNMFQTADPGILFPISFLAQTKPFESYLGFYMLGLSLAGLLKNRVAF